MEDKDEKTTAEGAEATTPEEGAETEDEDATE